MPLKVPECGGRRWQRDVIPGGCYGSVRRSLVLTKIRGKCRIKSGLEQLAQESPSLIAMGRLRGYTRSMAISHSFLGLLEQGPQHGYLLKHRYDDVFGGGRPLRFGQTYATLASLEKSSFAEVVAVEAGDGPDRKTYVITEGGVGELESWLGGVEPPETSSPGEFHRRVIVSLLTGRPVESVLDAQRKVHVERMRELRTEAVDASLERRLTVDFLVGRLRSDLEWIELAGERLAEHARRAQS